MFYCSECAQRRGWPETMFTSHGPCEICGKVRDCNDVPSALLPPAPAKPDPPSHDEAADRD